LVLRQLSHIRQREPKRTDWLWMWWLRYYTWRCGWSQIQGLLLSIHT